MRSILLSLAFLALVAAGPAHADEATQSRTILVDEGGSYEVPVHPDFVTVLYFPDKISRAVASDNNAYEVKALGSTSLAIRPLKADAKPSNLAIATDTIKVSVVLSIAKNRSHALTQVTFKRADVEAQVQKEMEAAVRARTADLEAQVAQLRREMDEELPKVAESLMTQQVLARRELKAIKFMARNADNVVVRLTETMVIGDHAFILFSIQNRDQSPYRLTSVRVRDGNSDRAGVAQLVSTAAEASGAGVIGVVPPGGRGNGAVIVHGAASLVGRPIKFSISQAKGRGTVAVEGVLLK